MNVFCEPDKTNTVCFFCSCLCIGSSCYFFSFSFAFKAIIPCFVCAPQIACQRINCSYAWENRHLFEVWARFRHSSFACRCGVKVRERTILSWGRVHVLCFFSSAGVCHGYKLIHQTDWVQINSVRHCQYSTSSSFIRGGNKVFYNV